MKILVTVKIVDGYSGTIDFPVGLRNEMGDDFASILKKDGIVTENDLEFRTHNPDSISRDILGLVGELLTDRWENENPRLAEKLRAERNKR